MINIYIDQLSAAEVCSIFSAFADKQYLSRVECNLNEYNSSIRIECYGDKVFGDLAQYYYDRNERGY